MGSSEELPATQSQQHPKHFRVLSYFPKLIDSCHKKQMVCMCVRVKFLNWISRSLFLKVGPLEIGSHFQIQQNSFQSNSELIGFFKIKIVKVYLLVINYSIWVLCRWVFHAIACLIW